MKHLITLLLTAIILINGCSEPNENPNLPPQNTEEALFQEEELPVKTYEEKYPPETQKEEIEQESEKELKSLQEVETDEETLSTPNDLSSWLGTYYYIEYNNININDWGPFTVGSRNIMNYKIFIYKKNESYNAHAQLYGSMIGIEMELNVLGDENEIELFFSHSLPNGINAESYFGFQEGDLLLKLKNVYSTIYTEWCLLQPLMFPIKNTSDFLGIYFTNYYPPFPETSPVK